MLHGRERETAAITTLLDEACAGRGGALVLQGLPGSGKSALLALTTARMQGMTVLRTSGIESEAPLPFAALQRLLRPIRKCVDRLPEPQGRALRAALGEAEAGGDDRFVAFLAVLSVLADAGEQRPVLAVVDDAHWLDDASAAALQFVARRVSTERIAILFAARLGDVRTFDSTDLPTLVLSDMGPDAASELLRARAGVDVPDDVRDALLASTRGNPLALVELTAALSPAHLSGQLPLPSRLPLTDGVERAFLDRCRRLPPAAQTLLLVAAADDSGHLVTIRQAAARLGVDEDAFDAAEHSGLLEVRDGAVELRHPLVRSAVYGAATSIERRRAHRALADTFTAASEADRRAWHLAASVTEPDAAVVAELDQAAERAHLRGGLEAAASALERAAELSPPGDDKARRLYGASRASWLAAQAHRSRALADAALLNAADPSLRADIVRLRARIEWNTGSLDAGCRLVLQGAADVAPHDEQRAREMAMFAAALTAFGARPGLALDPTALVPVPGPTAPPRERCFSELLFGLHAVATGTWGRAVPALRSAFELARQLDEDDQDLLPNLGIAALLLGDDEAGLRFHDALLLRARSTGAVVMILYALTRRAFPELALGRWTSAGAGAAEALPLAEGSGQRGLMALPTAMLALLAALRGEVDADLRLAEAERVAAAHPTGILTALVADVVAWAKAVRVRDDAMAAVHHLQQIRHPMLQHLAALDRLDAAGRAGRADLVQGWCAELETLAAATQAAWAHAASEHGRALLAEGDQAEKHFTAALAFHERSGRSADRARTHLAFGESLRRARRRVDAREHLREALKTFEDLGAEPLAERARQELRASGETARRRDASAVTDLTAQELQVARLVRSGLSNRDVAAQLFLSPRTIDFHLRNVFTKLAITSRTELAAHPLD